MKRYGFVLGLIGVILLVAVVDLQAQAVVDLGGVSNDGGGVVNFGISDGSNNEKVAQRFTGLNATISKISVALSKTGNPTDNIVVEIRQDSQTGLLLASGSISGLSIGTTRGPRYEITVAPTFMVSSLRNYYAVFSRSGSSDGRNFFFAVRGTSGSVYGGVTASESSYLKTGLGWAGSNLANSFILSLIGTPAPPPPATPSGLTAAVAGNQVSLSWSPNIEPALAYYKIYRNQTSGFVPSPPDSIGRVNKPVATFTDAGLVVGTYYYRVAAVDSFNSVSGPSTQATAVVVSAIAPPVLGALAPALSLDSVLVGASGQKTLVVANTGGSNLSVTVIAIGGVDASQFSAAPSSTVIIPGASQNVTVTFSPTSIGSKLASLTLIHNAAGSPTTINLSGYGSPIPVPGISISTAVLAMDSTNTGASSQKTITVTNTGTAALTVSSAALSGPDAAQFTVAPTSATIGVGANQIFTITFTPASTGAKTASLTLTHNAAGSSTVISLSGVGRTPPAAPAPVISISVGSLAMDSVVVGVTSQKSLTITNTGAAALVISSVSLSGVDANQFSVAPTSASVTAGSNQVVVISFAPTSVGSKSASLAIVHNASGSPTPVSLSGIGKVASSSGGAPVQPPSNQPPLAVPDSELKVDFTLSAQKGSAPLNVKFQMNITPYLGAPTRRFVFYTGAGDSLVNNPYDTVVYSKPGVYTPALIVYFEDGRIRSVVKPNYITVLEPAPSIDFTASPLNGAVPLSVTFKARNIGGAVTGYTWNLGDTTIAATADSLVHRYQKGGTYTIILTATGPGGTDTKTKNGYIVLSEPPPTPLSPADFDGSGGPVGLDDYFLFAAAFGQPVTAANRKFDLNQDGAIDLIDFFFFAEKFGK